MEKDKEVIAEWKHVLVRRPVQLCTGLLHGQQMYWEQVSSVLSSTEEDHGSSREEMYRVGGDRVGGLGLEGGDGGRVSCPSWA